jgi:hypothetical protein
MTTRKAATKQKAGIEKKRPGLLPAFAECWVDFD